LKIESQQKLKALFDEGCCIKVFRGAIEVLVSDIYENTKSQICYTDEASDGYYPLSEVRESNVRVFKEVAGWAGGES
jgi:hypothetical protein